MFDELDIVLIWHLTLTVPVHVLFQGERDTKRAVLGFLLVLGQM